MSPAMMRLQATMPAVAYGPSPAVPTEKGAKIWHFLKRLLKTIVFIPDPIFLNRFFLKRV